jgi:hypothetical protein
MEIEIVYWDKELNKYFVMFKDGSKEEISYTDFIDFIR